MIAMPDQNASLLAKRTGIRRQPPQTPQPPPWGAEKLLGYEWLVQPVLDRHCIRCHGRTEPDGDLDFTSRN